MLLARVAGQGRGETSAKLSKLSKRTPLRRRSRDGQRLGLCGSDPAPDLVCGVWGREGGAPGCRPQGQAKRKTQGQERRSAPQSVPIARLESAALDHRACMVPIGRMRVGAIAALAALARPRHPRKGPAFFATTAPSVFPLLPALAPAWCSRRLVSLWPDRLLRPAGRCRGGKKKAKKRKLAVGRLEQKCTSRAGAGLVLMLFACAEHLPSTGNLAVCSTPVGSGL